MNWLRGRGTSYSGSERPAQPAKRINSVAHRTGRTTRDFMRGDHTGIGEKNEQILCRMQELLREAGFWNKNAGYAAAYDFVFGARLVDRLGGMRAELRPRSGGSESFAARRDSVRGPGATREFSGFIA